MQFTLSLIIDRKKYNIIVKQIKLSRDSELFEIIGKDRKIYKTERKTHWSGTANGM